MVTKAEFAIEVPGMARNISDDHWQEIDTAHIKLWTEACDLLRRHEVTSPSGLVTIEIDWQPVVSQLRQHYEVMKRLYAAAGTPEAYTIAEAFDHEAITIPVVAASADLQTDRRWFAGAVLQCVLHDVFLAMNLAAPGSCNFYHAKLLSHDPIGHQDLELSEFLFDLAYLNGRDGKWPTPKLLPLDIVLRWMSCVRSGTAQIPRNPSEKVLFAMLHMAQLENSPVNLVWLFYALETLLDAKPGQNLSTVTERCVLLLEADKKQVKFLKRNLREMYNIRSAFVHGGLQVLHPMHNEGLELGVEEEYLRIAEPSEFGFQLLLTLVQATIERGWRWPRFSEVVEGESLAAGC